MKRLLVLLCCFFYGIQLITAQTGMPLNSQGPIPRQLVGTAEEKAKSEISARGATGNYVSDGEKDFIAETRYYYTIIANSGKITFGDSMSIYANLLLDKILKNDPNLRSKLKVCILNEVEVNAFILDNGLILITTGLLLKLDNEAQLAFILAHESIHYKKKHSEVTYNNSIDVLSSVNSSAELNERMGNFSKKSEFEADREGMILYKESGYAISEALSVMWLINDDDLSFGQKGFSPTFFNQDDYKFPSGYARPVSEIISPKEDQDIDTHPTAQQRIDSLNVLIDHFNISGIGEKFQLSEKWFYTIQQLSRNICCSILLEERAYPYAIYVASLLCHEDSLAFFPKLVIGKALYQMVRYGIEPPPEAYPRIWVSTVREQDYRVGNWVNESYSDAYQITPYDKISGYAQSSYFFFCTLPALERAVLALNWNWRLHCYDTTNLLVSNFCDSLMKQLIVDYKVGPDFFFNISEKDFIASYGQDSLNKVSTKQKRLMFPIQINATEKKASLKITPKDPKKIDAPRIYNPLEDKPQSIDKTSSRTNLALSLMNASKYEEVPIKGFDSLHYFRFAFVRYFNDREFTERYSQFINCPSRKAIELDYKSLLATYRKQKNGLGVDTVVVLTPSFFRAREIGRTKRYRQDVAESITMQEDQIMAIQNAAKSCGMTALYLLPELMDTTDVETYNTYCMLMRWVNERALHGNNALVTNVAYMELTDSLIKRLGTRYVMTTSVYCEHGARIREPLLYTFGMLLLWPISPLFITYGLIPRERSKITTVILDIKTGDVAVYYEQSFGQKAKKSNMTQSYIQVFSRVKRSAAPANPN